MSEKHQEQERQIFLKVTMPINYWRQRWEGDHFVYATTQKEWEIWQLARDHMRKGE